MARDIGPQLEELLSSFRETTERIQEEPVKQPSHIDEGYIAKVVKVLIWLAGIGSCAVFAWWGSGRSELLTSITLLLPLLAWHIFGLWTWMLLLPISLMGLLALQGAILLW
jgi:hypothetical protein